MLDLFHLPPGTVADVQIFGPNAAVAGVGWSTWRKPRGVTMCTIFGFGSGGGGGNGVVGANSTAAGGGGGGSGGQTYLTIPAALVPDVLFISVGMGLNAAGVASRVAINPDTTANNCLWIANGGGVGGNGAGATAGAAGSAGAVATIATMPLAGLGTYSLLAGQAGIIGGTTVAGAALTIPTTGLVITGGTGGGGLPAAATNGKDGGAFTVAGVFPPQPAGLGATAATTPGGDGSNGFAMAFRGLGYNYGGTGGGTSHGSATGAGLVGGKGGAAGPGCGGGGGGGALTGSTQGTGGRGGDGSVVILAW